MPELPTHPGSRVLVFDTSINQRKQEVQITMVTTNDLLTFFHVLMELTDADIEISHVDPDDGLVEVLVQGHDRGVWLPAQAAAERIRSHLHLWYEEEDRHENLLEDLLHKSPVTTDDVLAYIKVMARMAPRKLRITDLGINVDEVEVQHNSDRRWLHTLAAARYISEQLTEVENDS